MGTPIRKKMGDYVQETIIGKQKEGLALYVTKGPTEKNKLNQYSAEPSRKKKAIVKGSTGEFYWTYKEGLQPILHELFQKTEEEETPPHSFYEASINLTLKPDKGITTKEHYRPISLMNIYN